MLPLRFCCTSVNESSFMQSLFETSQRYCCASGSARRKERSVNKDLHRCCPLLLVKAMEKPIDQDSLISPPSFPSATNSLNLPISAPIHFVTATKSAPQLTKSHPSLNLRAASSAPKEKYPANFPAFFAALKTDLPAS